MQVESKCTTMECIDHFHSEFNIRSNGAPEIVSLFKPLEAKSLVSATQKETVSIPKLATFYDKLSDRVVLSEVPSPRQHLKTTDIDLDGARHWAALDFLTFIAGQDFVQPLPMLILMLQLFLTISA